MMFPVGGVDRRSAMPQRILLIEQETRCVQDVCLNGLRKVEPETRPDGFYDSARARQCQCGTDTFIHVNQFLIALYRS